MVRWNNTGVRGFGSTDAAQHFINRVCMALAPAQDYSIEQEFPIT